MAFKDLREYIETLKQTGDLTEVDHEVDWNLEVGAIIRRISEGKRGPSLLFNKIKDYPSGYRILGEPMVTYRHLSVAMGMPVDSSYKEVLLEYGKRINKPIRPIVLNTGSCKENIITGDAVDILKFPIPFIHGGDGGRYCSTWHVVILKDPESGWVNWGMYRQMVHEKNLLGGLILPFQHGGMIRSKYQQANRPMEFAVAFGSDPLIAAMGACCPPYGVNEADIAGGLRQEPVELVKCETVDLYVPATSEIVLEGIVPPDELKVEGPFGEYTGYQCSIPQPRPVYRITAITHRHDPILPITNMGVPVDSGHVIFSVGVAYDAMEILKREGLPVTGIYMSPESALGLLVVAVKTPYPNTAAKIASCLWGSKVAIWTPKIIVVDEDVDPTDLSQVFHAFAWKCHPKNGHLILDMPGTPTTPFMPPAEKELQSMTVCCYDCTWPKGWSVYPLKSSFETIYPDEIKRKVTENWTKYGLE